GFNIILTDEKNSKSAAKGDSKSGAKSSGKKSSKSKGNNLHSFWDTEAVVEHLDTKRALWKSLDELADPHTIFATNTSSLSIVEQATATTRGDRFVGLHFFNPVPAMRLVEVVRTLTTSEATMRAAYDFVRKIGKEPIASKDTPGFVVNLLLVPYMLDAVRALERGVATVADIDVGMQLGAGHPMGPLALCDFVGLD
ncbi:3-hydroxybutyryl-CoA dehydrogenase, partial [bacterium]|nr:3-hydroxybutyryl-CoA dehydrogenase [bacterium]